jgi:hypothetical protein
LVTLTLIDSKCDMQAFHRPEVYSAQESITETYIVTVKLFHGNFLFYNITVLFILA